MKKIIIAGGGIAGLTFAQAIQEFSTNFEVVVYESKLDLSNAGSGITLWGNALDALSRINLDHEVRKNGFEMQSGMIATANGKILSKPKNIIAPIAIHRSRLHQVLMKGLSNIVLGKKVVGYEYTGSAKIRIEFDDGSEDLCDILIGADGIHSNIRKTMFTKEFKKYSGYGAWRGIAMVDEIKMEEYSQSAGEYWGKGTRFGFIPISPTEMYWFAVGNFKENERPEFQHSLFGNYTAPIPSLIAKTPRDKITYHPIYSLESLDRWHEQNVVLVGDAAHGTTPNMGQGACISIEGSVKLAYHLARSNDPFNAYFTSHKKKAEYVIKQSGRIGKIGQSESKMVIFLRNLLTKLVPEFIVVRNLSKVQKFALE